MDDCRQEEVVRRITMYVGGRCLLRDAAQVICSMSYKSGSCHGVGKEERVNGVILEQRTINWHKMTRRISNEFLMEVWMDVSGEFSGLGKWALLGKKTTRQWQSQWRAGDGGVSPWAKDFDYSLMKAGERPRLKMCRQGCVWFFLEVIWHCNVKKKETQKWNIIFCAPGHWDRESSGGRSRSP